MNFTIAIGCDVGKGKLHFCIVKTSGERIYESDILNKDKHILDFIKELKSLLVEDSFSQCMLCMEHTGIYCNKLVRIWLSHSGQLSIVPAQKIADSW